jgi:hypothetical protein
VCERERKREEGKDREPEKGTKRCTQGISKWETLDAY